jgi:hydrogenase maturation protease
VRDALPAAGDRALLIGVGNAWRGDDAAGLIVARRVRELGAPDALEHEGDAVGLIDAWTGSEHVVIVDAASSGAAPGAVHRFDARAAPLPAARLRSSTHAFGVADAVELARALGRLPARLEVLAIEGRDFALGARPTAPVSAAIERLARSYCARMARSP